MQNPQVQKLARELAERSLSLDFVNDFESWLRNHSRYRDEYEEVVRMPEFMVEDFKRTGILEGDCDDFATFAGSVVHAMNIPSRLVAVRTSPDPNFDHVFLEAHMFEERFQRIDPTVDADTRIPEFERMEVWI